MPVLTEGRRPTTPSGDRAASPATTSSSRSPTAPDRFRAAAGPFAATSARCGRTTTAGVAERIDYQLAPMVWPVPFAGAVPAGPADARAHALVVPAGDHRRPRRHLARVARARSAVVFGYIGTLLSQTITFAADEFGATKADQGATLAAVRDRRARRAGAHRPGRPQGPPARAARVRRRRAA